jgi:acetyl-CoA acyltransferase
MEKRIAIIDGLRSPFCPSNNALKKWKSCDLGAFVARELVMRSQYATKDVDAFIVGDISIPPVPACHTAERMVKKAFPNDEITHFTIGSGEGSGVHAVTTAMHSLLSHSNSLVVAGATASSHSFHPFFTPSPEPTFLLKHIISSYLSKIRAFLVENGNGNHNIPALTRYKHVLSSHRHAEHHAHNFKISREEQDKYTFLSLARFQEALRKYDFEKEIVAVPSSKRYSYFQTIDKAVAHHTSLKDFAEESPLFSSLYGMTTMSNTISDADGAAMLLLSTEEHAKEKGVNPLGYIRSFAYASAEKKQNGMGAVFALAKLLDSTNLSLEHIDLIEIFGHSAAHILSQSYALESPLFASHYLSRQSPLGSIHEEALNVNGDVLAYGSPYGVIAPKLIISMAYELKRKKKNRGLVLIPFHEQHGIAFIVEKE